MAAGLGRFSVGHRLNRIDSAVSLLEEDAHAVGVLLRLRLGIDIVLPGRVDVPAAVHSGEDHEGPVHIGGVPAVRQKHTLFLIVGDLLVMAEVLHVVDRIDDLVSPSGRYLLVEYIQILQEDLDGRTQVLQIFPVAHDAFEGLAVGVLPDIPHRLYERDGDRVARLLYRDLAEEIVVELGLQPVSGGGVPGTVSGEQVADVGDAEGPVSVGEIDEL